MHFCYAIQKDSKNKIKCTLPLGTSKNVKNFVNN